MPQGQQSAITAGLGSTQAPRAKTRRQLLAAMDIGGRYNLIVGPASTMADALPASAGQTGVHGFNLARTITPRCLEARRRCAGHRRRAEGGRYARCCRCDRCSHGSHGSMPQDGISGGGPSAT